MNDLAEGRPLDVHPSAFRMYANKREKAFLRSCTRELAGLVAEGASEAAIRAARKNCDEQRAITRPWRLYEPGMRSEY